jgi:hypothetical protein
VKIGGIGNRVYDNEFNQSDNSPRIIAWTDIVGMTAANPIVVTKTTLYNLATGDWVKFQGITQADWT